MKISLSKKEYLKLHTVFGKEIQFSEWLSTDGIDYIKEALGCEVISNGTEVKPNNKFSVDILLSVDSQESKGETAKIVIENQYGMTDHKHFSKLITYAVTNEAKYAVWIAEKVHPEHKKAIDFLNENTSDNIHFYLLKASLEKLDNSSPCFSLVTICEPNEEKKLLVSSNNKDLTKLKKAQLKFWSFLSKKINSSVLPFRGRKPLPQQWYNVPVGSSDCYISINLLSQENKIRLKLWINNNKDLYDKLYLEKEYVEATIGRKLIWDRKDDSIKASSISYEMPNEFDIHNESKYKEYCDIIITELSKHFYKFEKILKKYSI